MSGLVEPILTSGLAAKWYKVSHPSIALATSSEFRRSPCMNLKSGLLNPCLMFSKLPLLRLSRTQTLFPRDIRASARWLPMKPAPPVTKILLKFVLP